MNTSFKLTTLSAAILTAAMFSSSTAYAGASANVGVTTNYLFRGLTQTDDAPAISAGLDYETNGFSIGTWASNVDFGTPNNPGRSYEVDVYGGYGGEVGAFNYSAGFITYIYPDDDNLDFTELTGGLGYGPVSFDVAYTVDADSAAQEEDNVYYSLSASTDVSPGFTIGALIGHNEPDTNNGNDYDHYQLSLSKGDFTAAIDLNDDGDNNQDDIIASLSWVHTFDF